MSPLPHRLRAPARGVGELVASRFAIGSPAGLARSRAAPASCLPASAQGERVRRSRTGTTRSNAAATCTWLSRVASWLTRTVRLGPSPLRRVIGASTARPALAGTRADYHRRTQKSPAVPRPELLARKPYRQVKTDRSKANFARSWEA